MLKKLWDKITKKDQEIEKDKNSEEIEVKEDVSSQEDLLEEKDSDETELQMDYDDFDKLNTDELEMEEPQIELQTFDEKPLQEFDEEELKEFDCVDPTDEKEELEISDTKEIEIEEKIEKVSLFKRLKEGLSKTKKGITDKIDVLIKSYQKIDEELFEELEEILISADIGVTTTMEVIDELKDTVKERKIDDPEKIKEVLQEKLANILNDLSSTELNINSSPVIILVVGVNGVGKTTSIGKIAYKLKKQGKKVMLAAGDTFRAAAIDQLNIWGDRVGIDVIKHQEGSDPAAVIYDAIQAAKARNIDVLICDTAGRLHNKKNLMNELGKVFKVVEREFPEASKEVLLVLDATTGQNAIQQAKTFKEVANITGLVLTKLDGTAKGGIVIAISRELNIPVKLIGVGEKMEDLQEFHAGNFVKALFGND